MNIDDLLKEFKEECLQEAATKPLSDREKDAIRDFCRKNRITQPSNAPSFLSSEGSQSVASESKSAHDEFHSKSAEPKRALEDSQSSPVSVWALVRAWLRSPALGWATACLAIGFALLRQPSPSRSGAQVVLATMDDDPARGGPTRGDPGVPGNAQGSTARPVTIAVTWGTGAITITDKSGMNLAGYIRTKSNREPGKAGFVYDVAAAGYPANQPGQPEYVLIGTMTMDRETGTNAPTASEMNTMKITGQFYEGNDNAAKTVYLRVQDPAKR